MKVLLSYVMLALLEPFVSPGQEDTQSLALKFWFDDECFSSLRSELLFKTFCIRWEHPCLRKEIVMFGHGLLHQVQVTCEKVFARQDLDVRQMIDPLVISHFLEKRRQNHAVDPPHIPVIFILFIVRKFEVGFFGNFS